MNTQIIWQLLFIALSIWRCAIRLIALGKPQSSIPSVCLSVLRLVHPIKMSKFNLRVCTEIISVAKFMHLNFLKFFSYSGLILDWVRGAWCGPQTSEPQSAWAAQSPPATGCIIARDTEADCADKSQRGPAPRWDRTRGGHPAMQNAVRWFCSVHSH